MLCSLKGIRFSKPSKRSSASMMTDGSAMRRTLMGDILVQPLNHRHAAADCSRCSKGSDMFSKQGNEANFMRTKTCVLALLGVALAGPAIVRGQTVHGQTGNIVRYTTTIDNVKYLFATAEPVAHLKSGDILDTNPLDCFGNPLKRPGDTLSMVKGDNPLAGPFFVEGAEPGDTLAAKILDLQVDGDTGVDALAPGFG